MFIKFSCESELTDFLYRDGLLVSRRLLLLFAVLVGGVELTLPPDGAHPHPPDRANAFGAIEVFVGIIAVQWLCQLRI
jgi:hypothetical protein